MFCRKLNDRYFWGGENFLKIAKTTFLRHPVSRKFRRNRSISHGSGDRSKFVFCHFWQKFEHSKWPPFLGSGKFFENCRVHFSDTLWVENFDEIALSRMVKVLPFFKNSKRPPFLGRGKFFANCQEYIAQIPCGSKISTKSLFSRTVKEIEPSLCFAIFGKNSKIQNGHHFWGGEIFFKIAKSTFLR